MKFSGKIGFWNGDEEVRPGVWKPNIKEVSYTGDVLKNSRRLVISGKQNADLITTNQISIISDGYLMQNWSTIRYVVWNGVKWEVTNVEIGHPRITLDLGGVYNGEKQNESSLCTMQYPRV